MKRRSLLGFLGGTIAAAPAANAVRWSAEPEARIGADHLARIKKANVVVWENAQNVRWLEPSGWVRVSGYQVWGAGASSAGVGGGHG